MRGVVLRRILSALVAMCFVVACGIAASSTRDVQRSLTPVEHHRGEEQTWLTFPEWYLVHSPAEFARYMAAQRPPSEFPFLGHVGQLWSSYGQVIKATRDRTFNAGYHVMIVVIATSTTIEYGLREAYEVLIGRLGELTRRHGPTAEEKLAAKVAQDYVDFVRVSPWYDFDFWTPLRAVWRDTGCGGDDVVRKWERKYALSTEYLAKGLYGWVIRKATHASYEAPLLTTAVVVDRWVDRISGSWPEMKRVSSFRDGGELVLLPRYEAFKGVATALARSGANFVEIAGNPRDALILVSVLVSDQWQPDARGVHTLFEQPVLTEPGRKRAVLEVRVGELAQVLREFDGMQVTVEHAYDY
ncbi:hypothetical protein VVD49_02025 [Uliginosibacterium sp. H3]|uniref:Uncharacterized protein n=1 Tax=Uliginosibacterium silvisoli TaxID=3114758 RepID=A0ABU6K072_9RHOO|nr:hypothetical protein [Uliginosibacterium sp. H3]